MRSIQIPCLAICFLFPIRAASGDDPAGPLTVPILTPRFAPFLVLPGLSPPPARDELFLTLGAGTGQVWKGDSGPGGSVGVSAQTVAFRIAGAWGIMDFLQAGWEIPLLVHAHSFKKADEPFHLRIRYGEADLADSGSPGCGLSDARLSLALVHRRREDLLRHVRLSVVLKVPSGGRKGFEGTGREDIGGFLDLTLHPVGPVFLHGLIGVVRLGDPPGLRGGEVNMKTAIPFRAGLEWRLGKGWGIHLQVEGSNNFYPPSGHDRLDEHPVQATLGVSFRSGTGIVGFLGFSEDLTRSAPDFALSAGVGFPLP